MFWGETISNPNSESDSDSAKGRYWWCDSDLDSDIASESEMGRYWWFDSDCDSDKVLVRWGDIVVLTMLYMAQRKHYHFILHAL